MKFEARIPDYHGEDESSWVEVEAYDCEEAARKLVEEHDDECSEGLSEGTDVQVKNFGGEVLEYHVRGWISYSYTARLTKRGE